MALTQYRLPVRWCAAMLLLATCCVQVVAHAEQAAKSGVELLDGMKHAARTLDYAGVFTYQQGAVLVSSHVVHMVDTRGERQRVETLDGRPHREFVRLNDEVRSLYPELRMVLVEKREVDHFPVFFQGDASKLAQHYDVILGMDPGRVAGRSCQVLELQPRDDVRWGYRLCLDDDSGLLLKVQTLNASGVVLEQVAFSEVKVGGVIDPAMLEPKHDTTSWREVQPGDPVDLRKAGWNVPAPDGFVTLSQMERALKHGKHVRQMLLSDGIAAISVFIETRRGGDDGVPDPAAYGATSVFSRQLGDHRLTVIGEVPSSTVKRVAESIEFLQAP